MAKQPAALQYNVFSQRKKELVWRSQENVRPSQIAIEVLDPGLHLSLESSKPVIPLLSIRYGPSQGVRLFPCGFCGEPYSFHQFSPGRFFVEQTSSRLQRNSGCMIRHESIQNHCESVG